MHENKLTQKSSADHSGRQCIVHFDNLENIRKHGLLDRDWIQLVIKDVTRKRLAYASRKDGQNDICHLILYKGTPNSFNMRLRWSQSFINILSTVDKGNQHILQLLHAALYSFQLTSGSSMTRIQLK